MKRLLATILVFSAISFLACDEDDKKVEAITSDGEISIIVVERETAQTPEKEFKSQGGMVTAAYAKEEKGNSMSVSKTLSFTALIKIPLQVKIEKEILSLVKLDIANTKGALLYSLSGEPLAALKKEAKFGLELTLLGTKDGSVPQEVRMNKKTTPPSSAEPDKNYVPVAIVFPDPLDIVRLPDTENTLKKLREVATATEEYHRDLLKVVTDTPSLDTAHLDLLLDACYYPYAFRQQMEEELIWEKRDEESQKLMEAIQKNLNLADQLAGYTREILNVGMAKVSDLTLENASELLKKLFPYGGADRAFIIVIEKFSPLAPEKKLELLTLALQKGESTVALNLAIDWFQHDSNKSLAALIELVKYFSGEQKDRLLLSCYESLPSLTTDELMRLVQLAYYKGKTLALNRVNEVSDFSISNTVRVIRLFSGEDKDDVAEKVLSRGGALTAAELRSVLSVTYYRGERLAKAHCNRISNMVPGDVATLANMFSGESKDNVLLVCSERLESMTTDALIGMINVSYYQGVALTKMHYLKLVDFSATSIAKIANRFSGEAKDTVIAGALDTLTSVTSDEVKRLISASYYQAGTVSVRLISKISDLTVVNAVGIARGLNSDAKDPFLLKALTVVTDPSGDNILSLAQSAYGQGMTVLMRVLERVTTLTVAQSITIARSLSYENKDAFLLRAVDRVIDLSTANLMSLASQAPSKKDQIIQKGLERLSQPK
ncbi:MAG: hypothetical protein HYY62_04200 [Deltaproteobacteria bacterium]|nr:hypothetical protein [Deltaproteobacteria bacterium]